MSPAPVSHLRLRLNRLASQGSLVHCAATPERCIIVVPLFVVGPSFEVLKIKRVAGTMRIASRPGRFSKLDGLRLTNRCSGPGHIKCMAAGGHAFCMRLAPRARVLTSQRAAAELNR
jgi:hypothetical protein